MGDDLPSRRSHRGCEHYVKEKSPLDEEAYKRGTSVYLVDRVIPMLPHRLSNGICSLNAGCDRLAMSCLMDIDEKGIIVGHKICESVVNIDRRMTYTAVNAILEAKNGKNSGEDAELEETNGRNQDERFENDEQKKSKRSLKNVQADDLEKKKDAAKEKAEFAKKCLEEYEDFVPMFLLLDETARVLREKRMARGAVDFDFPECKIILDAKGRPVEIKPYERNAATMLIEDCMLAANETVAEDYYWQQAPFLYRSHEKPDGEKIKRFGILINNFGYSIRLQNGELHPKEMQKLLAKAAGSPEEALLARLALRSMKQAKYTTDCMGHFGLAANYYTTSPPQSADTRIFRSTGSSRRTFTVSSRRSALPTTRRSCRRLRSGHHPGNALRTRRSGRPTRRRRSSSWNTISARNSPV